MMMPPVQDASTVVLIAASNRDENHVDDGRSPMIAPGGNRL
jgi:hypothetical protein